MSARYAFDIDAVRNLAIIEIAGFFSAEEVLAFERARDAAFGELRGAANQHATLVDMRGMRIQPQEAVAGFGRVLGSPRWRSRRLAFVVVASLARMQIERAAAGRDVRLFTSVEEAMAWLLEVDQIPIFGRPVSRHPPRSRLGS